MPYLIMALLGAVYGTWPMWGGEPAHHSLQTMKGAMSTEPVVKWRFPTNAWVEWQFSAVGDVDNDGKSEVLALSYDRYLHCFDGTTGAEEWKYYVYSAQLSSSSAIAQLDGDPQMEVVVGGYGYILCIDGASGVLQWSSETTPGAETHSSPALADCDGDGEIEVLIGSMDSVLYCLRAGDGTKKWRFRSGGSVRSSPAVADCDGDGMMEVVFGSYDGKVYCLSGSDGTKRWEFATTGQIDGSPAIADLDKDGGVEVVIGSQDRKLYCLAGSDGAQKWSFTAGDIIITSSAIGDCDGDGYPEVITASYDKRVYCLDRNGVKIWEFTTAKPVHCPLSLVDVDGVGGLEVLVPNVGANPDTLYCLRAGDGSLLWKKPISEDVHSPVPADIDDDGCAEIVVGTHPDASEYSFFALDDPGDNTECGQVLGTGEVKGRPKLEFRPQGNGLYLFLPSSLEITLSLYDTGGRLVQNIYNGVLEGGSYSFSPKAETGGVFIALLRHPGGTYSVKILRF
ncbi:MAG: PQQ-binding-like beta-propeller repeat protein [candidate division WOR-3 bacterium]